MVSAENLSAQNRAAAAALQRQCLALKLKVCTAESLTGGLIAATLTEIPGSSGYFDSGFVVYNNEVKHALLGVGSQLLLRFSEYSHECAAALAEGALKRSGADLGVGVSGIAGPDGGSAEKPVGSVWAGVCRKDRPPLTRLFHFTGDRKAVRLQTVAAAVKALTELADGKDPEGFAPLSER